MSTRWSITKRPRKFSEVLGQEPVIRFCKNVLAQFYAGKADLPVGFLFGGRSGVGKTTLARVVGASLNCPNRDGVEPCGECPSCKAIVAGEGHVIEVDAAFFGLVDNIRQLREELQLYSVVNYKVVVLDEAHMMSKEAFNVLLKLLESPPERTMFILCTTETHKVLETVRSRLTEFRFTPIHWAVVGDYLEGLLKEAKVECEPQVYYRLYRLSNDNFRDVIVSLEQLVNLGKGEITEADVSDMFGDIFVFEKIIGGLKVGDYGKCVELYAKYSRHCTDFERFLDGFLTIAGDAFLWAIKGGSSEATFYGKLFASVYKFLQTAVGLKGDAAANLFFHVLATEVGGFSASSSSSEFVSEAEAISLLVDKP